MDKKYEIPNPINVTDMVIKIGVDFTIKFSYAEVASWIEKLENKKDLSGKFSTINPATIKLLW